MVTILVLNNDPLSDWKAAYSLANVESVDEVLHVVRCENGHLPHAIRELASEGCAGEFLCDAG